MLAGSQNQPRPTHRMRMQLPTICEYWPSPRSPPESNMRSGRVPPSLLRPQPRKCLRGAAPGVGLAVLVRDALVEGAGLRKVAADAFALLQGVGEEELGPGVGVPVDGVPPQRHRRRTIDGKAAAA